MCQIPFVVSPSSFLKEGSGQACRTTDRSSTGSGRAEKGLFIGREELIGKVSRRMLEVLQVETTDLCNARCIFCAHDQIEEHGTMSNGLYTKILTDASKLDSPIKTFIPMLTGEPFLDPQIVDRIKEARASLPMAEINLYTNGSRLTEESIRRLAEVPGFRLNISANGASVETRKRLTGLDDYEYVARMIDYVDAFHIPHTVSLVQHTSITIKEVEDFDRRWGQATSSSSCRTPYVFQHLNFAGLICPAEGNNFTRCIHATSHMTVLRDGRVNLCCMDPLGKRIFGDLKHQAVAEAWFSEGRQHYVARHEEGRGNECELCSDCNIFSI